MHGTDRAGTARLWWTLPHFVRAVRPPPILSSMNIPDLGFAHRFVPATGSAAAGTTLLLLHGTGGTENDLLGLGPQLVPGAALLSPRGKSLDEGYPRFFRRLAEGVFDEQDLIARAHELADFVAAAAARYRFDPSKVLAVGYSNGANVAAAAMLLRPATLAAGVLLRAMVPLVPASPPNLSGKRVFIAAGRADPIVPRESVERLADLLRAAGADVTLSVHARGHPLEPDDVGLAREWFNGIRYSSSVVAQ